MTGASSCLGTSFRAVLGAGAGSQLTSWGQGASVSRFSAEVPGLSLSGDAATGALGMDYERGPLLTGFALTHSVGDGRGARRAVALRDGEHGDDDAALCALRAHRAGVEWAMAGTGSGSLTLDLDGAVSQHYDTDCR